MVTCKFFGKTIIINTSDISSILFLKRRICESHNYYPENIRVFLGEKELKNHNTIPTSTLPDKVLNIVIIPIVCNKH